MNRKNRKYIIKKPKYMYVPLQKDVNQCFGDQFCLSTWVSHYFIFHQSSQILCQKSRRWSTIDPSASIHAAAMTALLFSARRVNLNSCITCPLYKTTILDLIHVEEKPRSVYRSGLSLERQVIAFRSRSKQLSSQSQGKSQWGVYILTYWFSYSCIVCLWMFFVSRPNRV